MNKAHFDSKSICQVFTKCYTGLKHRTVQCSRECKVKFTLLWKRIWICPNRRIVIRSSGRNSTILRRFSVFQSWTQFYRSDGHLHIHCTIPKTENRFIFKLAEMRLKEDQIQLINPRNAGVPSNLCMPTSLNLICKIFIIINMNLQQYKQVCGNSTGFIL